MSERMLREIEKDKQRMMKDIEKEKRRMMKYKEQMDARFQRRYVVSQPIVAQQNNYRSNTSDVQIDEDGRKVIWRNGEWELHETASETIARINRMLGINSKAEKKDEVDESKKIIDELFFYKFQEVYGVVPDCYAQNRSTKQKMEFLKYYQFLDVYGVAPSER